MFSTEDRLKRRTPKDGIDRREYISLLVDEYYETGNAEARHQVSANLANFAYDPINWRFLKQAKAHELFIEILDSSTDPLLLVHAAAGICNLCLDDQISEYIIRGGTVRQIKVLLEKWQSNGDLVGHILTTLIYLNNEPLEGDLRKLLQVLQRGSDKKTANLAALLLANHAAPNKPEDLVKFAEFTGDSNPIHQHQSSQQSFVNGALLNATTAGIIGCNFPGCVVTSQEFRFPNRCRLDEEVLFTVKVEELRKIVLLSYECTQSGQTVFVGTAKLFALKS